MQLAPRPLQPGTLVPTGVFVSRVGRVVQARAGATAAGASSSPAGGRASPPGPVRLLLSPDAVHLLQPFCAMTAGWAGQSAVLFAGADEPASPGQPQSTFRAFNLPAHLVQAAFACERDDEIVTVFLRTNAVLVPFAVEHGRHEEGPTFLAFGLDPGDMQTLGSSTFWRSLINCGVDIEWVRCALHCDQSPSRPLPLFCLLPAVTAPKQLVCGVAPALLPRQSASCC